MKKTVLRPVQVFQCDDPACGAETAHYQDCALCKLGFCMADGGQKHFAYHLEVYRYGMVDCLYPYICKTCAGKGSNLSIDQLVNLMMSGRPVMVPSKVA